MNYDEACRENIKIANQELSMFNDLHGITSPLKLKRIPIQAKDINDHEHTEIDPKKTYLVNHSGRWIIGNFRRTYHNHGWEINVGMYSTTLSSITMIYELEDLPVIPTQLLDRVEYPEENEDY